MTYRICRLRNQAILCGCFKISQVSIVPVMGPGVTSNVLGAFVTIGVLIISRDRLIISHVWLTRQRRVDGCAEVVRVRVEVGGALAKLRERLGRHGAELIR